MNATQKMTILVLITLCSQLMNAQFNTLTRTPIKKEPIAPLDLKIQKVEIQKEDQTMKKSKFMEHIHYISLIDHLCKFNNQKYYCRVKPNDTNDLIQVDYGHLSKEGSLFVVNNIIANKISHLYKDN